MTGSLDRQQTICAKLQELGYARENHIRLYGEEFHLVSNPMPDGAGYVVEGTTRKSASIRRMRIPLSIVYTLQKNLDVERGGLPAKQ